MYVYSAHVTRVVDGDTIYADVDLGFRVFINLAFRLVDIDTAEIFRPSSDSEKAHGLAAKEFLEELILDKDVMIHSKKMGKYGRWLAEIYIDENNVSTILKESGFEKLSSYDN